ncbi:hypothetical protein CHARACLAT_021583 [Characodon lateralis]|uniref:Uncharacterized protein n=1 Tax=Characodon lateralis TaxID=208331 RepID=A0ABU7EPM1_9TELE|nr:hypothetical protein [Characodon lateralis]
MRLAHVVTVSSSFYLGELWRGDCIDVLLFACLNKVYIWHREKNGGPNTTNKKQMTLQMSPLSKVSTFENRPELVKRLASKLQKTSLKKLILGQRSTNQMSNFP